MGVILRLEASIICFRFIQSSRYIRYLFILDELQCKC